MKIIVVDVRHILVYLTEHYSYLEILIDDYK